MTYVCPVCGYDKLDHPPRDYMICPCCETEFGYDDFATRHAELREQWIANGAKWHAQYMLPPIGWSAIQQLRNIGYEATNTDKIHIARADDNESSIITRFSNVISSVATIDDVEQKRLGAASVLSLPYSFYAGGTVTTDAALGNRTN